MQTAPATHHELRSKSLGAVVASLVSDALEVLDRDAASARLFLVRASAILDGDRLENAANDETAQGLAPWRARRVMAHIEANLASTITLQEVADLCRLSRGYFSRAFKITFGQTFSSYVTQKRVEAARTLLATTDKSVCEIASICGFADQSHLCRLFRKVVGLPPQAWRRKNASSGTMPIASMVPPSDASYAATA